MTERCPVPGCHGECVSVEEERIEKAEGFTGGDMLKWVSGCLLIILIGLILFAITRNISDERLLGRRDVLTTDIQKLKSEKSTLDSELEPARATIAEAGAVKEDRTRIAELERRLTERGKLLDERERKTKELDGLEAGIRDAQDRLDKVNAEIKLQEELRERINGENERIKKEVASGRSVQRELQQANGELADAIAESSKAWTNLTAGVISSAAEVRNVAELRAIAESWRKVAEKGQAEFVNATNAISALTVQYSGIVKARSGVDVELKKLTDQASAVAASLNTCGEEIKGMISQLGRMDKQIAAEGTLVKQGIKSSAEIMSAAVKNFEADLTEQRAKAGRVSGAVEEFEKKLGDLREQLVITMSRMTNVVSRTDMASKDQEKESK